MGLRIEAGAAFRANAERAGYQELTGIRRQLELWQREASQDFVPFAVGFVELPEGRVEARIAGDASQELRIGMLMDLTVVPFATDEDGTEVLTYAFQPVEEG